MENVSHNTSYSEASPNVYNEDEEFVDSKNSSKLMSSNQNSSTRYRLGGLYSGRKNNNNINNNYNNITHDVITSDEENEVDDDAENDNNDEVEDSYIR